jgi:peroxiredoxin Q/BCP
MRKHDLITILLFLVAGAAAFIASEVNATAGQFLYLVAALGLSLSCKFKGAYLQGTLGVLASIGFGYVLDNWAFSFVMAMAFLAVNGRIFFFREDLYMNAVWVDLALSATCLLGYIGINIYEPNGWMQWVVPAPYVAMHVLLTPILYNDKKRVRELLSNGLIEIGKDAPDFSLENFDGKNVSLNTYKGNREVLLIFVRGDWCPGCHIMLRLYERERKQFQDKNVMLIAVGPDPVGVNKAMVEKLGLEYAVLSDADMSVSKKYCVKLQEGVGEFEHGIPLPASFLIDKGGVIRYTSRADNAGEFLSPDIIFDVMAKL